jgi:hypothetical protein
MRVHDAMDVSLNWLLSVGPTFAIDTTDGDCHTPRRNGDVIEAMTQLQQLHQWCGVVFNYMYNANASLSSYQTNVVNNIITWKRNSQNNIFCPIIPSKIMLMQSEVEVLLKEHTRSFDEVISMAADTLAPESNAVRFVVVVVVVVDVLLNTALFCFVISSFSLSLRRHLLSALLTCRN